MQINFQLNNQHIRIDVHPLKRLLDLLRDDLGLTAAKEGCGKGECGACTVLMNGQRVNSCLIPAFQIQGAHIITLEGVEQWRSFKPIEQAFIEHGAVQCGFCIPGLVMSVASFLNESTRPITIEQIKLGLAGNICRCTGYSKIIEAVHDVASRADVVQQIREDFGKRGA